MDQRAISDGNLEILHTQRLQDLYFSSKRGSDKHVHVTSVEYTIHKRHIFRLGNVEGRDRLEGLGVDWSQRKSDLKDVI